uniref:Transposase n=1 Tax=Schistocephalus solidus TaxID=70667 RepID=A0A183T7Q7_SCHSO
LAANSMVEQFHHQLKACQSAADDLENWTAYLPLIRLGICSARRSNLDCSTVELEFGAIV